MNVTYDDYYDPGPQYGSVQANLMVVSSTLSIFFSIPVFIAFILRPSLREKTSMEVALYIQIANCLSAMGAIAGEPRNKTATCYYQGIVTNAFPVAGILWTIIITYILYEIITTERSNLKIRIYHHIFCWGFPILIAVLPFANVTYGSATGSGWCFILGTDDSPGWAEGFWVWMSFYAWLYFGIVICLLMFAQIMYKLSLITMAKTKKMAYRAFGKIFAYPWIVVIAWTIPAITDSMESAGQTGGNEELFYDVYAAGSFLGCLNGFFTAVFFLYTQRALLLDNDHGVFGRSSRISLKSSDQTSEVSASRRSIQQQKVDATLYELPTALAVADEITDTVTNTEVLKIIDLTDNDQNN